MELISNKEAKLIGQYRRDYGSVRDIESERLMPKLVVNEKYLYNILFNR